MKKWIKWTLGVLTTLISGIAVLALMGAYMEREYKKNYVQARHENKQTLLDYSKLKGIPGEILIAKDMASYKTVSKYFQPGTIIVLDSKNKIVDINNGAYGGSCYFDIATNIFNDFNFKDSKYDHKIKDSILVSRLKSNTQFLTDYSWEENNSYDYTVIFCWAKWMKTSFSNEGAVEKINAGIKRNPKRKVLLVSVNSDCVAPWYPLKADLPSTQF